MSEFDTSTDLLRDRAIAILKKRRDFRGHVLVYLLVNSALVVVWALTSNGFFWPVFPLVFWGIGVVMNAWDVYVVQEPDEETIAREMRRLASRR
ncbi:MAG TPA: 2TM domain-containing protein [Marmoricola sp.]